MFAKLATLFTHSTDKATKVHLRVRCLAKGIDLSIILLCSLLLPYPFGVLLGFIYTILHDGLFKKQSLGKRLFHLKVISKIHGGPCTIRDSIIRNSPLGVATFFGIIPFWGWILLLLLGIPLVILELYLMVTSDSGDRLGDVMADTHVIQN